MEQEHEVLVSSQVIACFVTSLIMYVISCLPMKWVVEPSKYDRSVVRDIEFFIAQALMLLAVMMWACEHLEIYVYRIK